MEIAFPKNQTDKNKSEEDFLWKNERVENAANNQPYYRTIENEMVNNGASEDKYVEDSKKAYRRRSRLDGLVGEE
jgi:hypothetical protein